MKNIRSKHSLVEPGSMKTSNIRLHLKKHSAGVRNVHFLYPLICVCHDGNATLSIYGLEIHSVSATIAFSIYEKIKNC